MKKLVIILILIIPFHFHGQVIKIPDDYPTIQGGIEAAKNGDTVLVADGIYYERINFKGKAITLSSYYLIDGNASHIDNTIIEGGNSDSFENSYVVYFENSEDTLSILSGFTLRYWPKKDPRTGLETGGVIYLEYASPKFHEIRIVDQSLQAEFKKKTKYYKIWITANDNSYKQKGYLFQLNKTSLALVKSDRVNQGDYSESELKIINIHHTRTIKLRRKGSIGKGVLIGALSGLAVGVVVGLVEGDDVNDGSWDVFNYSAGEKAAMYGLTFMIPGAAIGAIVGSIKIKIPIGGSMDNYSKNRKRLKRYTIKQK